MKFVQYAKIGISLLWYRLIRKRVPVWVTIDLTPACNQTCTYCDKPYAAKALDESKWLDFIDQAKKMGTLRIGMHGGEPLLHPGIKNIIKKINDNKMISHLYSNGQLVPSKIDDIKDIDGLFISLDGNKDQHDKNRSIGSHEKAIAGIKAARENNIPVTVICTLTSLNTSAPVEVLKVAREFKTEVVFQLYSITPDSKDVQAMDYLKLQEVFEQIIDLKKSGEPISNSLSTLKLIKNELKSYPNHKSIYENRPCWGGKLFCEISADSNVFPCFESFSRNDMSEKFLDVGFESSWNSLCEFECSKCTSTCGLDTNELLSLSPRALTNAIRSTLFR